MSSSFMPADIASLLGASSSTIATNSTSRKNNTELDMQDFLQLMIVQLQNQTMDDTMDTSEMMNQMVQMQMISAITNMTEATTMTYASSLVGKVVTIGIVNGDSLEEREVEVIGTGVSNGQQVIFGKDDKGNTETYSLNQIMAVGRLPEIEEEETPGDATDKPNDGVDGPSDTQKPDGGSEGGTTTGGVDGSGSTTEGGDTQPPDYNGEQGAPTE